MARTRFPQICFPGALEGLKDFQQRTVDYVFSRLYGKEDPVHRFLVADEVGLGKTMVARGVIAKAIEHLSETVQRIDVVYICSNADIARQNIRRLKPDGAIECHLSSRITLLPTEVEALQRQRLNFVSFTPGTSFDLKSNLGTKEERALLYWLLDSAWGTGGSRRAQNVLQGTAGSESFREMVQNFRDRNSIDSSLAEAFAERLAGKPDMRSRFEDLCAAFGRSDRQYRNIPEDQRSGRVKFVGGLRSILAETCLDALEPDLIILDEFQRFRHLLDEETDTGRLAHGLFNYNEQNTRARVLLLSATPYKMYTIAEEAEEDHYNDFMRTVRFLQPDNAGQVEKAVTEYRAELCHFGSGDGDRLAGAARKLETLLRRVMVRTERLAATEDRSGMLCEVAPSNTVLAESDVDAFLGTERVAEILNLGSSLEYWKSAPYLLNFMEDYRLKELFHAAFSLPQRNAELAAAIASYETLFLPWKEIIRYGNVDPANARLRGLITDVIESGMWKLLWMPPSLPYYRLQGPFGEQTVRNVTKRLVFSSWKVVPKVVATMTSYAAERCMMAAFEPNAENSTEARNRRPRLLKFSRSEGRLTGMPLLGLLYPCLTLARECDPLLFETERLPTLQEVLEWTRGRIEVLLQTLSCLEGQGNPDEAWYWAAPILLDRTFDSAATLEWFSRSDLPGMWSGGRHTGEDSGEDDSVWAAHVEHAQKLAKGEMQLGTRPADLANVLAEMAVAGPGIAALRALSRVAGGWSNITGETRGSAGEVAWGFRSLFNLSEVTHFIRSLNRQEPYWRRVLEYAAHGCLQSVLDEYAHTLRESLGLVSHSSDEKVKAIAQAMTEALTLRTSVMGVDDISIHDGVVQFASKKRTMRGHFALRFGEERNDDGKVITRPSQVRDSFNSPFWPFVLATTSVGQEGLDFHTYCHAVVHWNLPSNPVDMEQREGRVHRYKGHAVRKNLANRYGIVEAKASNTADPWDSLFEAAKRDREHGTSDLIPFWIFPLENGARIERHVPLLPLSRDGHRLTQMKKSLAVYRMVFGQARQEDMVAYLLQQLQKDDVAQITANMAISLEPPGAPKP